ncbi:MAG TPA: 3-methyl-2-oxobutanoate hydroxymethyltransferase [Candidatus Saccharimonadales bacterium]|nr:3-methyl-2-oxobutanoate hydroxymethyltransferase [Candidatus Saccharimonadales bacterium]
MTERKRVTLPSLFSRVTGGQPITMLTCYDYSTASLLEQAGIDIVLVGDSLGMTMLGFEGTLPVTMDDMVRHAAAVRRGTPNAWLVGDLPYMSYQPSVESAIRNAGRFMAEAGCDCVKLEGGLDMVPQVAGIARAGIPVMGHLGLTPQSVSALGGFRVQGKGAEQAKKIVDDARALEEAGAFAVLLELVPDRVCELVTKRARTSFIISLGSGPRAHGQLLIYHDMFGLYPRFKPRMAKVYADAGKLIGDGLSEYVREVQEKQFPQPENYFTMADDAYEELVRRLADDGAAEPDRP